MCVCVLEIVRSVCGVWGSVFVGVWLCVRVCRCTCRCVWVTMILNACKV